MLETDSPTVLNENCAHPLVKHYHGTLNACVMDRCRCEDCVHARRRYNVRYYRRRRSPSPTPSLYRVDNTTPPLDWRPGSEAWLTEMRAGLKRAVEESIAKHGRVA